MKKKILAFILILIGLAALGSGLFLSYRSYMEEKNTRKAAVDALERFQEMIPERSMGLLYDDDRESDMPVLEINRLPVVGCIEIPETGKAFIVQNQWGSEAVSRLTEGNVSNGTGVIHTDRIDFDEIYEGMTVSFVDINGIVYDFLVDYIGNEHDIVHNAKLIIFDQGMTKVIQIACIEK